jgi:predicted unusual protein kinase regulating ubiquinone biosynthesis (AarF/ABC1/UbiB family)
VKDRIPETPWQRGVAGSKTAAKVGGKVLKFLAQKPFLSRESRSHAKADLTRQTAEVLFQGLSLLRGTALKLGQLLSMELDLLPPEVCKELEKSYNQVPPLNRALVRKVVQEALGGPPEAHFQEFNLEAFAAASLGQVHRARSKDGEPLAVKIQYPGIQKTIRSDLRMVKAAFRSFMEYDLMEPALEEIEERLIEETDYLMEADNCRFFFNQLDVNSVHVPQIHSETTTDRILSASFQHGRPLNEWLKGDPSREEREKVAEILHEIFLKGLYELNCIHADPNPGNFIIREDLDVGLVDFGCVKRFDPEFVENYRKLPITALNGDKGEILGLMKALQMSSRELSQEVEEQFYRVFLGMGEWLGRLYRDDFFDFGKNPNFMAEGKELANEIFNLRSHMDINPNFVFMDRTRYGLLRIFEAMKVRVKIRNPYELDE